MDETYAAFEGLPLDAELSFSIRNSSALKQRVTKVFELLRDPVYRYLFRVLENSHEAEDLTQQVFLRLYVYLHKGPDGDQHSSLGVSRGAQSGDRPASKEAPI